MTADPKPDATPIDLVEKLLSDEPMTRTEAAAEITRLNAELAEAQALFKSAHAVGFAAGIEAAIASILKHSNIARKRMAECYDELDPDGYNGWGDIASHLDIELDAIRALTPPDITAAAARVLLDKSGAANARLCDIAEDIYAAGASMNRSIGEALRALAEVKP